MNKITLIENDEDQSDFIIEFPLKDIAVDGKSLRAAESISKQLRITCWSFGIVLVCAIFFLFNQNREIIKALELPKLNAGDKISFTSGTVGQAVGDSKDYKWFTPGVKHTITRVGSNQQHFRIEVDGKEYKFHNARDARDSLIKINE
jgi:hypothetical protein